VIPGVLTVDFNLRYSPASSIETIQSTIKQLFDRHAIDVDIDWNDSARPFITHTGSNASLDTGGGTSDGRFIAPTGAQVIEFGPSNATIHQIDERILCDDINLLSTIYESVLIDLLT